MSYILSLKLPLAWFFLPLIIATLCAYKYYQVRYILRSGVSNLKRDNSALQGKLEAALAYEKTLRLSASQNLTQLKDALTKLHKLESDAAEREALIVQLNKKIKDLDWLADFNNDLADSYKSLSDRKQDTIEQIQADLVAAIAIMNRTIRGRKQWGKYEAAKQNFESNKTASEIETVAHDSIGVPRIVKADQSENDNGRHDVMTICDEVNRGVKEQAEAIRKELEKDGVDMSTLEKGDTVIFRNNDKRLVLDCGKNDDKDLPYFIKVEEKEGDIELSGVADYTINGYYWWFKSSKIESPFDIIQIIKPAKFDPQIGELVALVDSQDFYSIIRIDNGRYLLSKSGGNYTTFPLNRPFQDLLPIKGNNYKNGYRVGYCYKTKRPCQFDCDGLCKDS